MNKINSNIEPQANEAALLNILMYLNVEDVGVDDGWKMKQIIDSLGVLYNYEDGDDTL